MLTASPLSGLCFRVPQHDNPSSVRVSRRLHIILTTAPHHVPTWVSLTRTSVTFQPLTYPPLPGLTDGYGRTRLSSQPDSSPVHRDTSMASCSHRQQSTMRSGDRVVTYWITRGLEAVVQLALIHQVRVSRARVQRC